MMNATEAEPDDRKHRPDAKLKGSGEYLPSGEAQGQNSTFGADQVAHAFDVDLHRVHHAMDGEFGLGPDAEVDSKQAQQLAEVLLTERSLELREAALMNLGAFTPRPDHDWGSGEKTPDDESDRQEQRPDQTDGERG